MKRATSFKIITTISLDSRGKIMDPKNHPIMLRKIIKDWAGLGYIHPCIDNTLLLTFVDSNHLCCEGKAVRPPMVYNHHVNSKLTKGMKNPEKSRAKLKKKESVEKGKDPMTKNG